MSKNSTNSSGRSLAETIAFYFSVGVIGVLLGTQIYFMSGGGTLFT